MAVVEDCDFREEIKAAIRRGSKDPYAIAKKIEPMLSDEQRTYFVYRGLIEKVREIMTYQRTGSMVIRDVEGGKVVESFDMQRFKTAALETGDNTYSFLRNLTAEQCDEIAAERKREAKSKVDESLKYSALAKAIRKHGVKTVGELPEIILTGIMR